MGSMKTYKAPHPVYQKGKLTAAGEPFVTDDVKGEAWVEVTRAEKAASEASDPTLQNDVPLETLSKAALEAVAATKGVNPDGLTKAQLIDAIKAADEPAL